jgi:cell division protein FtsB
MRLIILCLSALLLLIQYPLWLGKGGWLHVWDMDKQVQQAQKKNDELKARNAKLASEVDDLKQGTGAVEERARYELGMIKQNEVFIQVLDGSSPSARSEPSPTGSTVAVSGNMMVPATAAAKAPAAAASAATTPVSR